MKLPELQQWILSENGLRDPIRFTARYSAAKSLDIPLVECDIDDYKPEWPRLLFSASILAKSDNTTISETALMIVQAGLLYSKDPIVIDASTALLSQLANQRAIGLAQHRGVIAKGLESRLGIVERMLITRRELSQSVFLPSGEVINANHFQRKFWSDLEVSQWVSASAPTASGKTYLVLRWLLNEFAEKDAMLAIYIAPTRALVSEIERNLLELAPLHGIKDLRVTSLPLAELGNRSKPTILVLTQERLHVFFNSVSQDVKCDIAIVDEAQKLADGQRGVILQDAIERIFRANPNTRFVFLSPLTKNPEILLSDAPTNVATAVVPSNIPTVTQNVIVATQKKGNPKRWELSVNYENNPEPIGSVILHAQPDTAIKRLSYLALAVGKNHSGTLIYSNGAAEAEKIAWQIFDGLGPDLVIDETKREQLQILSDFARDTIHPQFQLVTLLQRGIAFHYGNMPTLLKAEIERLFRDGTISFLVCTSTLIEGVNLACRTILVRGPRKGNGKPMQGHDFWNLAGRAGRWGQDFHGNIICIDVNNSKLWPTGTPRKELYPIQRKTETVLADRQKILEYINKRQGLKPDELDSELEQVVAYLLSWRIREGNLNSCPAIRMMDPEHSPAIIKGIDALCESINVPVYIIIRHPGISATALQNLLNFFRATKQLIEDLIPARPTSDDAYESFTSIFKIINHNLENALAPDGAIPIYTIVTLAWMRGLPLGQIINGKISYNKRHNRPFKMPQLIRDTMGEVEEIARFKAPKYLAAYLDILKFYLQEAGRIDLFPDDLKLDLFLEFGVATKTLLSLIGLGLSRTSAIAINDYLADDSLSEDDVLGRLVTREWDTLDLSVIIKKEIDLVLRNRLTSAN